MTGRHALIRAGRIVDLAGAYDPTRLAPGWAIASVPGDAQIGDLWPPPHGAGRPRIGRRVELRLGDEDYAAAESIAAAEGRPVAAVIRDAVIAGLATRR